MLLRSINGNGESLMPVLTLMFHTPSEPEKVTQPAATHRSPGPPSNTLTVVLPSKRLIVATADAGVGPVTRAAQPSITARPTAITALVSFINPPWPTSYRME